MKRRTHAGHSSRARLSVLAALLTASLALAACGSGDGAESAPPPCDPAQTIAIQAAFRDEAIPSDVGAVAVVKDAACGSRYFTRGASTEVPETALHLVGSVTKTYIASLILLLVDEGGFRCPTR